MKPAALVASGVLLAGAPAAHAADDAPEKVEVLPGASQKISHSLSASRDTALLAYQLTPYSVLTAGGDVAVVGLDLGAISMRFGFFGMLELESDQPYDAEEKGYSAVLPFQDIRLWRGQNGFQIAVSYDEAGRRWFGERGLFEATLGFRHESEHYTGSTSGNEPQYRDVPHIGDFVLQDFAARIPVGPVDLELRLQNKLFLPTDAGQANGDIRAYSIGPGFDFIVRWRLNDWLHPFSSSFGEYLMGNQLEYDGRRWNVPDDYKLRNLTGVIFPGTIGDVQVFTSVEVGHGKGLKVYREELLWGGGIRLALF